MSTANLSMYSGPVKDNPIDEIIVEVFLYHNNTMANNEDNLANYDEVTANCLRLFCLVVVVVAIVDVVFVVVVVPNVDIVAKVTLKVVVVFLVVDIVFVVVVDLNVDVVV